MYRLVRSPNLRQWEVTSMHFNANIKDTKSKVPKPVLIKKNAISKPPKSMGKKHLHLLQEADGHQIIYLLHTKWQIINCPSVYFYLFFGYLLSQQFNTY